MAPGSTLVHDKEDSHNAVVRELGPSGEAHDSRAIRGLPDEESPLRRASGLCFLLRTLPGIHTGFDRANLQGWLDLFHVMTDPPHDRLRKAAMLLDRAMTSPNTLRYRDFYGQRPSFGE